LFDIELITKLVELMAEKDLREIDLRDGDSKISLRRGAAGEVFTAGAPQMMLAAPAAASAPASAVPTEPAGGAVVPEADEGLVEIPSPMVGTFYAAPSPEAPPYVTVGTTVGPESVVCIVEAMKVFNEIKAEVSGTIERILVQNQQPVEFGQPLFLVRPSG
jgi:acetyl-CoA carboxylase biotin carboxyl carrier protein